jgi:hypothetical protein
MKCGEGRISAGLQEYGKQEAGGRGGIKEKGGGSHSGARRMSTYSDT